MLSIYCTLCNMYISACVEIYIGQRQVQKMKIVYTNKAMNKQKGTTPSLKTIILMTCVVLSMVAIKVIYNPSDATEEVAAMAEISGETLGGETEELY